MDLATLRKTLTLPPHLQAKVDAVQDALDKATTPREQAEARKDGLEVRDELQRFLDASVTHVAFKNCVSPGAGQSTSERLGLGKSYRPGR